MFLISFENEGDLKLIMEGQPWLFRKQIIVFERLTIAIERKKIHLNMSPFWLKIGTCPYECDKKDSLHAIGFMFVGLIRSEVKEEFYHLLVYLDIQKPLRRGIFVSTDNQNKR